MQISAEPKGWSDAEVEHLLDTTDDILVDTGNIEQVLMNQEYLQQYIPSILSTTVLIVTALYALVFLTSVRIGWSISPYFLPTPKDLAP